MAGSITSLLSDLAPDSITTQAGTLDGKGGFTASGSSVAYSCRIVGRQRLVRDLTGREVTSSYHAIILDTPTLTVDGHRYTLPARFDPRTDLQAIAVSLVADENGSHHVVVFFP